MAITLSKKESDELIEIIESTQGNLNINRIHRVYYGKMPVIGDNKTYMVKTINLEVNDGENYFYNSEAVYSHLNKYISEYMKKKRRKVFEYLGI